MENVNETDIKKGRKKREGEREVGREKEIQKERHGVSMGDLSRSEN